MLQFFSGKSPFWRIHTVNLRTKWVNFNIHVEFSEGIVPSNVICRDLTNNWLTGYRLDKWFKHKPCCSPTQLYWPQTESAMVWILGHWGWFLIGSNHVSHICRVTGIGFLNRKEGSWPTWRLNNGKPRRFELIWALNYEHGIPQQG